MNNEDGAVLFHCSQGKDRTGFGAILLLAALGVDEETIMADFALSNASYESMLNQAKTRAKEEGWTDDELERTCSVIGVSEKFMKKALNKLKKQDGSIKGFLKNKIKLTDSEIRQLRRIYLE